MSRFLLSVAALGLLYSAYSTYEYVSYQKALGNAEGSLPLDIVLVTVFSGLLGIVAASLTAPPLKEITWACEMKIRTIDQMDERPGFASYHGRARNIFNPPATLSSDDL